jgi:fucose 4-O-acetylase-like acetyltransferase
MRTGSVHPADTDALAFLPAGAQLADDSERLKTIPAVGQHQRIAFLDVAKGIGILLVVMGHCLGGLHAAGIVEETSIAWFAFYLIYSFHMPLFFFLTGSLVESRILSRPRQFLQSTITRIAYPYFLWGSVQLAVLSLASSVVTNPVSQPLTEQLLSMLWAPPGPFWFLYALFFLHVIALLTVSIGGKVLFLLAFAVIYATSSAFPPVAGLISSYVSGTDILFYVLGVSVGGLLVGWRGNPDQPYACVLIAIIIFVAVVWVGWNTGISPDTYTVTVLPAAFAGTGATLLLCRLDALRENRWLACLGRRILPIYLLHVMFVAGARILLVKGVHVDSMAVVLPTIFLAGVFGPLIVYHAVRVLRLQGVLGLG